MEIDVTFRGKKKQVSKEEINRRREKKLYFECGLPGYMASSHGKNKPQNRPIKKQVNAVRRGGYNEPRQVYIIIRRVLYNGERLEEWQNDSQAIWPELKDNLGTFQFVSEGEFEEFQ